MFMYMSNLIMPPLLPPLSSWHGEKFKLKGKEREKMCLRECDLEREWLQMRLLDRENATKREWESRDDARKSECKKNIIQKGECESELENTRKR